MASRSSSHNHCSAINCSNRQSKRPDLSFFRFPTNKERCQTWVENTCRNDLLNKSPVYLNSNCHICADHFEDNQFSNRAIKNRLKWNAMPTLFHVPSSSKTPSTPCKTMKIMKSNESASCVSKQQKEHFSPLVDHSYCKPNSSSSSSSSSSSVNSINRESPASSSPNNTSPQIEEELIKKEQLETFEMNNVEHLKQATLNELYISHSNTNSHPAEPLKDIRMPRPHIVPSLTPLETPFSPNNLGDSSFLSPVWIKQEPCEETTLPQPLTPNPYPADDHSIAMTSNTACITASTNDILTPSPSPSSVQLPPQFSPIDSTCESPQEDFIIDSSSFSSMRLQNVYSLPIDFPTMVADETHVAVSRRCLKTLMSLVSCPICQAPVNHQETIQGFKAGTLFCLNLFCYNGHSMQPHP